MYSEAFDFELVSRMPIISHKDDVMLADDLEEWRRKQGRTTRKAGDDRSPQWTWITYLYHDQEKVVLPQENLMAALRRAGQLIPHGKGSNLKSLTQSGLVMTTDNCEFFNKGKPVPFGTIAQLYENEKVPFGQHVALARSLGFELLVRRAAVGTSKHVRVRAKFRDWSVRGTVVVLDPVFTPDKMSELFDVCGKLVGLGDWRPSSKKSPGPHGTFTATVAPAGKGRRKAG